MADIEIIVPGAATPPQVGSIVTVHGDAWTVTRVRSSLSGKWMFVTVQPPEEES